MERIEDVYDSLRIAEDAKKELEFRSHAMGENLVREMGKCEDLIVSYHATISRILEEESKTAYGQAKAEVIKRYAFRKGWPYGKAETQFIHDHGHTFDDLWKNGITDVETLDLFVYR